MWDRASSSGAAAEDEKAIELLIGSDPKRAPSQLNKWGYLVEAMRGGESSVVGLISQENDDRLSDVKADLKTRKEQRAFDTIRGFVSVTEGIARVGTLYAPSHLTYHDADVVLKDVLADTSLPVKRVARRGNVRPGFLTTLTELISTSIEKKNDNTAYPIHTRRSPFRASAARIDALSPDSNATAAHGRTSSVAGSKPRRRATAPAPGSSSSMVPPAHWPASRS